MHLSQILDYGVSLYPDKTAILLENGHIISYQELEKLSNEIKPVINSKGVCVAILSPVHIGSIASVLAVLKLGKCYVPLDEQSPPERLAKILQSINAEVLIIDVKFKEKFEELIALSKTVIMVEQDGTFCCNNNEVIAISPSQPLLMDDLAYILHSSGSTGVPKGIMLTHRNAETFINWMSKEFKITSQDRIMSRAPLKFDLSVFDIFNTLMAGATLVCFDWSIKDRNKHSVYVDLIEKSLATILYTTPTTLMALLNHGDLQRIKSLRTIMYAGEPFPTAQLRTLMTALPTTKIANIYGPTETNIITYHWVESLPSDHESIPLGRVVDDTEIRVMRDELVECDPTEVGELWCRGGTVTLGYLGMESKTKECQRQSPFHNFPALFWKTGDFGYRDKEGILHYKGRKDHMIKVNGYRIELGEIETALASITGVTEFVAFPIPDETTGNKLVALYTGEVSEVLVLDALTKRLPLYMVPRLVKKRAALPKTSSEKIDRVTLIQEFSCK